MSAELTGGCGCGAVKFEISEPLTAAAYCHCTRCQVRTGTEASATAVIPQGSLTLLSGEEHLAGWTPEGGMEKMFCRGCGSHLFGRRPGGEISLVRLGAFDGDPGVRPQARQYVAYAAPWEDIPDDGLPRFDEAIPRR
ncbi:MAG TPA: GFA family protein [Thermoleophilaceae bacterium]|nr:GFA family protein [Thermoleophilaceae bacterium]